jgi:hypothetical protein
MSEYGLICRADEHIIYMLLSVPDSFHDHERGLRVSESGELELTLGVMLN